MGAPQAPWELAGECVVALARRRSDGCGPAAPRVPDGFQVLPGPLSLLAGSFDTSPVGAYLELAVAEPVRAGTHVGMCVTTMVVDSPESRLGGRLNWGFPKELGELEWSRVGEERVLRWKDRGIEVRGIPHRRGFPVVMPVRSIQRRADGLALVPGRLRGWGHRCHVEVSVPGDDPLAPVAGRHWGILVSGACLVVKPARRPSGLPASLRAPGTAPEPALSWGPE